MTSSRRVAIFTASRSEYGLLRPVIHEVHRAEDLDLQLIVAGAHLAPALGMTVAEIDRDGFPIDSKILSVVDSDDWQGAVLSMSLTLQGLTRTLSDLAPDVLMLLGDRYEALAAAAAATVARIPIAHIHGGETTEGAFDDEIRHALTKLAHLHFVANSTFRDRVVSMGESPGRVHAVGAPGIDDLSSVGLLDSQEVEQALDWRPEGELLLVTYHPSTRQRDGNSRGMRALLEALRRESSFSVLLTAPNADPGSASIRQEIEDFVASDPTRFHFVSSLGRSLYLSVLKLAAAVVGNSSSGVIEAPYLRTPTVDIGDRQLGRPRGASVFRCEPDIEAIQSAIHQAVGFRGPFETFYGDGSASRKIVEILRAVDFDRLLAKPSPWDSHDG